MTHDHLLRCQRKASFTAFHGFLTEGAADSDNTVSGPVCPPGCRFRLPFASMISATADRAGMRIGGSKNRIPCRFFCHFDRLEIHSIYFQIRLYVWQTQHDQIRFASPAGKYLHGLEFTGFQRWCEKATDVFFRMSNALIALIKISGNLERNFFCSSICDLQFDVRSHEFIIALHPFPTGFRNLNSGTGLFLNLSFSLGLLEFLL